jgi:hypothetical protein
VDAAVTLAEQIKTTAAAQKTQLQKNSEKYCPVFNPVALYLNVPRLFMVMLEEVITPLSDKTNHKKGDKK